MRERYLDRGLRALVACVSKALIVLPLVLLVACATRGTPSRLPLPTAEDDALAAGDVFEVKVYGEEELSGKYRIAEDGTINFPLVGPIAVGGKPQTAIAIVIQDALREKLILRNPNVSIFVADYASRRVTVLGAVAKPGSVALKAGMTVVQAISEAGGFTQLASPNQTLVTRRVDGKLIRVTVAVEKVTEGRAEDIAIKSGDTIYVPERIF